MGWAFRAQRSPRTSHRGPCQLFVLPLDAGEEHAGKEALDWRLRAGVWPGQRQEVNPKVEGVETEALLLGEAALGVAPAPTPLTEGAGPGGRCVHQHSLRGQALLTPLLLPAAARTRLERLLTSHPCSRSRDPRPPALHDHWESCPGPVLWGGSGPVTQGLLRVRGMGGVRRAEHQLTPWLVAARPAALAPTSSPHSG